MAKKKIGGKKKSAKSIKAKKLATPKKSVKKKSVKPKKTTARIRVAKKKSTAKKVTKNKVAKSLGRPRVTGEARLEQFFKKDYEARQVFDFLRVDTVKELEAFRPDEIIEQLTAPMVQTVERIRKALAMSNRCLKSDQKFAIKFQRAILQKK